MKLRTIYLLITLGLFCVTFLTFFLLGREPIDSLGFAIGNVCFYVIFIAIMVKFGMWKI